MSNDQKPNRIIQITATTVQGREKSYANVYGLDEQSRVWAWNAKLGKWEPHKIPERAAGAGVF